MAYRLLFALVFLIIFSGGALFGQPCDIPPSTDNCEDAPILCAFDEIDGYCTSMSLMLTYNAPSPLCSQGGTPDNPIWFAFYAGCTSLDITIIPTNCVTVQGQNGIQAAIYGYGGDGLCTSSNETPEEEVACLSVPCFSTPQNLFANNLTVGQIYYFMIDGCSGSYCDIEIELNSPCGQPIIDPWPQPIQGTKDVCAGETTQYTIEAPSGGIEFYWYLNGALIQEGIENTIEISWPSIGTFTLCVDASNQCVSVFENPPPTCIVIEVSEISLVILGDDFICEGEESLLDAGPGFNSYSWSTGETTQTISVFESGTYSVTVTDNSGCYGSEEITVTVNSLPLVVVSSNSPVCDNGTISLNASGGISFQWIGPNGFSSTVQNPSIPNAGLVHEGYYEVIVTNSDGCTATNETYVEINENPIPVINGSNYFCAGGFTILQVAPIYQSYLWNTGATTEQIYVDMAGTYTVTVTDNQGCLGIDTILVTVSQSIYPIITGDSVLCDSMNGALHVNIGNASYEWSTLDTTQSISVSNSGTYSVTVTDATGCSGIDSINVTTGQSPIGMASSNSPICIWQSIHLQGSGGTSYNWSGPAGFQSTLQNPIIPNTTLGNAGTYVVTVTNSGGCSDVDSTSVIIGDGYALTASAILPNCAGDTLFLFASGGNDYEWSGPNGFNSSQQNPFIINAGPQHNGSYVVTDPNPPVCVVNDTLIITIPPGPEPMITGNFNICLGEQATLDAGSGFVSYFWSTGQTGQTISVNAAGSYWVLVSNAMGCLGRDTATVQLTTNLNPTISGDLNVCIGDSSMLDAGAGYASYLWNTGDTMQIITVNTSGAYSVFVTNATGCEGMDTVQFRLWEFPQVSFNVDAETCKDSCDGGVTLLPIEQGYFYKWSNGDSTEIIQNLCSGIYLVTVTTPGGCFVFDATFIPAGVELKVSISDNDSTLIATASGGIPPYTYLWSNGDTLEAIPKTAGMHTVQVTDVGGCVQSATILITQLEDFAKKGRGIILYPNPSDGTLFISPLEDKVFDVTLNYHVFNAKGSVVTQGVIAKSSSLISVNTSPWPAGKYTIQLVYEGGEMEVIPIVVVH